MGSPRTVPPAVDVTPPARFEHRAFFYDNSHGWVSVVGEFVRAGLAVDQAVLVAVPRANRDLLCERLGPDANRVDFLDVVRIGANPAHLMPMLCDWIEAQTADGPLRIVGEPYWPARTPAEVRETIRHEALVNLALAEADLIGLCPYSLTHLPAAWAADVAATHATLVGPTGPQANPTYTGGAFPAAVDLPLSDPPPQALREDFAHPRDLARVRALPATMTTAGDDDERLHDLTVALGELATNSLRHGGAGGGTVWLWRENGRLVAQVRDGGHIADPLLGRRRPVHAGPGGRGLWLVDQLCDLVERRSHPSGTTTRVQVDLLRGASRGP